MKRIGLGGFILWVVLVLTGGRAEAWSTLRSWQADDPSFMYTPSPGDWRDVPMYQIFTDRFFDGNPNNNWVRGAHEPHHEFGAHGGDFKGIEMKLGYLQDLGAGSIWISPVLYNIHRDSSNHFPYHAYAPTDLNRIEPQFGSLDELRSLVHAAHRRGMYVIIDIVVNHLGDLVSSKYGNNGAFNASGFNDLWWHGGYTHAEPFNLLSKFHNHGAISDFTVTNQFLKGELWGLDDLRTEDPAVRQDLATIYKALISATDCDGFRIDAVRHVEHDFWDYFISEIRAHAAGLGKTNFLVFGEVFHHDAAIVGPYTGPARFRSMLDFPRQSLVEDVFVRGKPTALLDRAVRVATNYHVIARDGMVTFLDNHDMPRLLSGGKLNDQWDRLMGALTFHYTTPGIPLLYYGTEQGFNGGADPWNREDMFDGQIEFGPSLGDNFNTGHPLFGHIKDLILMRQDYPALVRGTYTTLWQNASSGGLFVYARNLGTQEAVVAINTAGFTQHGNPRMTRPAGSLYADLFDPSDIVSVSSSGTLNLALARYESRIYVPTPAGQLTAMKNTWHWPFAGQVDADDEVWINTETVPPGAAQSVKVLYSTNATDWTIAAMKRNGDLASSDPWHVNLGSFTAGSRIQFKVQASDGTVSLAEPFTGAYEIRVNNPPPVDWVGRTYHWPPSGSITAADDVWVNCDSWRKGSAAGAFVAFSTDNGASWTNAQMKRNTPQDPNNDGWHVNLGKFRPGQTIQYAVACSNLAGQLTWDTRGGQNYRTSINPAPTLQFIGHSWSWPSAPVKSTDTVWVNTETWPKGSAVKASFVYTTNGTSWTTVRMNKAGVSGNNDWWNLNLGRFPAGTTIRYALNAEDANGRVLWDSNNSRDYFITITSP